MQGSVVPEEDIESPGAGPPDDFKTQAVLKDTHDMGAENECCETNSDPLREQ